MYLMTLCSVCGTKVASNLAALCRHTQQHNAERSAVAELHLKVG